MRTSIPLRLCSRALRTTSQPAGWRRAAGTGTVFSPRRYWAVSESGESRMAASGPSATLKPPALAGAGPEVEDVVGGPDGLLVVLDDDDRVALVAEAAEEAR